jgi:hypothetical protein
MTRPRAADDFAVIRARMEELRREHTSRYPRVLRHGRFCRGHIFAVRVARGMGQHMEGTTRRSSDLGSLTNSATHSQASGIFPASRNARAFANAWLSNRRSAADSFPGRAPPVMRTRSAAFRTLPSST